MRKRSLLGAVVAGLALAVLPAVAASAHPLGNFTSNTADRVEVVSGGVRVLHVLDLAEVPTLRLSQASQGVDTSGDGRLDDAELTVRAQQVCADVLPRLRLTVDGAPSALMLTAASGRQRPGAADLGTARFECAYTSPDRPRSGLAFEDGTAEQRNGWKEVTLVSGCGLLQGSDVPAVSPSALLTAYPDDLLSSPLDVRSASTQVRPGGPCADSVDGVDTAVDAAQPRGLDRITTAFTNFVTRPDLTLGFVLGAVLLSIGFGALHALAPGHGKTVVAAYLIGQRGTRRQAVWLGAAVTLAHTASVLALGAVLSLTTLASPERVVPYAEVLSGVLLAVVGGYLLRSAVRRLRHAVDHDHSHSQPDRDHPHDHPHEHPHPHDHGAAPHASAAPAASPAAALAVRTDPAVHTHSGRAHSHAPIDDAPLGWRSLAAMGLAGGLVPSPSALVVLLGATALGRAWFGVVLVLCYGLGMALTLTVAGLLLLRTQSLIAARGWAFGAGSRATRLLPVVTAGVVVVVGVVLVVRGYLTGRSL